MFPVYILEDLQAVNSTHSGNAGMYTSRFAAVFVRAPLKMGVNFRRTSDGAPLRANAACIIFSSNQ